MSQDQPAVETRRFGMHPELLFSVIKSQAGSLEKALLELAQNAVDANATDVWIEVTRTSFKVRDNGRGITDKTDIIQFWETFGTPHQEGDATFGKFRMGRGQAFSFGPQTWRTHTVEMRVDIRTAGLDYVLVEGLTPETGCAIAGTLYSPMAPSALDNLKRELTRQLTYFPIPVHFNGKVINTPAAQQKWDIETPEAYIKLKDSGPLSVYNLGAYVRDYSAHYFGTSGIVVSKVPLQVNFARNDVLTNECGVWKAVKKLLSQRTRESVSKTRLDEAARGNLAEQVLNGEIAAHEAFDLPLLTLIDGRHVPLNYPLRNAHVAPFTVAPKGSALGDRVHQTKTACVLQDISLERFGIAHPPELMKLIVTLYESIYKHTPKTPSYVPLEEYKPLFDDGYTPIPEKELSKHEKVLLKALQEMSCGVARAFRAQDQSETPRKVAIGASDLAEAWTNGKDTIWISRRWIKEHLTGASLTQASLFQTALLLTHEYCHSKSSAGSHVHDEAFHERYHAVTLDTPNVALAAARGMSALIYSYRRAGIDLPRNLRKLEDADALARDADAAVDTPQTAKKRGLDALLG